MSEDRETYRANQPPITAPDDPRRDTAAIPCTRCGKLGKAGLPPNPKGRLMVYAQTAQNALCADCAATAFIKDTEVLMYGISLHGVRVLLDPRIQSGFADVMRAGKADATPEEINWQRVVDNWELPIPKQKKRGKR